MNRVRREQSRGAPSGAPFFSALSRRVTKEQWTPTKNAIRSTTGRLARRPYERRTTPQSTAVCRRKVAGAVVGPAPTPSLRPSGGTLGGLPLRYAAGHHRYARGSPLAALRRPARRRGRRRSPRRPFSATAPRRPGLAAVSKRPCRRGLGGRAPVALRRGPPSGCGPAVYGGAGLALSPAAKVSAAEWRGLSRPPGCPARGLEPLAPLAVGVARAGVRPPPASRGAVGAAGRPGLHEPVCALQPGHSRGWAAGAAPPPRGSGGGPKGRPFARSAPRGFFLLDIRRLLWYNRPCQARVPPCWAPSGALSFCLRPSARGGFPPSPALPSGEGASGASGAAPLPVTLAYENPQKRPYNIKFWTRAQPMAKAAHGRDQSDEATHENTPFFKHLFARPMENRGRKNPGQWRPLQGARDRNKTFFLFCCVRQKKRKRGISPASRHRSGRTIEA